MNSVSDLYMKVYLEQRYVAGQCRSCPNRRDSKCKRCIVCRAKAAAYGRDRRKKAA